ncbi:MAG TPA: NAD-dependent epimerase/dehydratase family protein [Anaerolineae bacterium]|nr:NAD-dependent epimerase/dehydratase family protein [Anaerolineae bacterium]
MSNLHVVFGAGPLGRAVVNELVRRGQTVRVVSRSGVMAEAPQGVELRSGDLYNPAAVRDLTQGAAVAYQCAQPHYWEWPQKFPPLQAAIIEGLAGSGTKLVIGENLYMYGDTDGRPLTEDLPHAAHTRKGQVRAAMSKAALDAHHAGKVPVTLGRGSDFFGPWALGSSHGERVFYPVLAGKSAGFGGKLDLPHTATYIEDFGRALVILGERDEALGQAWHVPNDRPQITQRQFAELVFAETGHPVKASGMGKTMLRLGGLFIPEARESVEMLYEFEKPFVVDSSRFEQTFGMKATPMAEAIKATVAWYRAHPQKKD